MYNYFISFVLCDKVDGTLCFGRMHLQLDHKIIDQEDIDEVQNEIERQAENHNIHPSKGTKISIMNITFLGKKTQKSKTKKS